MNRYDTCTIAGKLEETTEGYLRGVATVTRTGVFDYRNADGTTRKELRLPEEVFSPESMATLKMIPITNTHPAQMVNADNVTRLSVGYTGENVHSENGELLNAPVTISHKDGVLAVKNGRRELSLGYSLELEPTSGIYNGERYDAIQRNIKYNHLALVDSARAGSVTAIRLDAEDAVAIGLAINTDNKQGATVKVFIKGAEHDLPEVVVNHLAGESTRADDAEKELKAVKTEKDVLQARADELAAKVSENKDNSKEIEAAAQVRAELLLNAKENLDSDAFEGLKGKTNSEIMAAVITAKRPGFNADGKSAEYLQARFDSLLEDSANHETTEQATFARNQNQDTSNEDTAEAAYKRQLDYYKTKA
jgi:hypothetical protein